MVQALVMVQLPFLGQINNWSLKMAKLVKIKNVTIYASLNDESVDSHNFLNQQGIKHTVLIYGDEVIQQENLKALSSWFLGADSHQKECKDFPVLTWDECYDDWSTYRRIAHGWDEIKESDPVKYKELI